jgi:hypothetical protein
MIDIPGSFGGGLDLELAGNDCLRGELGRRQARLTVGFRGGMTVAVLSGVRDFKLHPALAAEPAERSRRCNFGARENRPR